VCHKTLIRKKECKPGKNGGRLRGSNPLLERRGGKESGQGKSLQRKAGRSTISPRKQKGLESEKPIRIAGEREGGVLLTWKGKQKKKKKEKEKKHYVTEFAKPWKKSWKTYLVNKKGRMPVDQC